MKSLVKKVIIPEGIHAKIENGMLMVKGPKGEVDRNLPPKNVMVKVEKNEIIIQPSKRASRNEKILINSFCSHVKNIIAGVKEPYVYKLKICSSHFPMKVAMKDNTFEVVNFFGGKVSRKIIISSKAKVKIEGDIITVTSSDVEVAGTTASAMEKMLKRPAFDRRVFMDGIYITEKAGVSIK